MKKNVEQVFFLKYYCYYEVYFISKLSKTSTSGMLPNSLVNVVYGGYIRFCQRSKVNKNFCDYFTFISNKILLLGAWGKFSIYIYIE